MPIHDFKCNKCDNTNENKIVSFSVADTGYKCDKENCKGKMMRDNTIHKTSFILKGRFH